MNISLSSFVSSISAPHPFLSLILQQFPFWKFWREVIPILGQKLAILRKGITLTFDTGHKLAKKGA
jgi:hypothetical protein